MNTNTPTELARRVAAELIEEAKWTEVAAGVGDAMTVAYGNQCRQSAMMLNALAAERDALAAEVERLRAAAADAQEAGAAAKAAEIEARMRGFAEMWSSRFDHRGSEWADAMYHACQMLFSPKGGA